MQAVNKAGTRKRRLKKAGWLLLLLFVLMNVVACFHAYKFTHFDPEAKTKTMGADKLSFAGKLKALIFGVSNPRPRNKKLPAQAYETVTLKSNEPLECWLIKAAQPKGTVIIFHGFSGEKSSMLDKADVFLALGYNTLLVDFMGSGGSGGLSTSVGFHEAQNVKSACDLIASRGEKNIVLFGTSMGAVAVMKAQSEGLCSANRLILECPFGTMTQTVKARFRSMHVPAFPMAYLLLFWGGVVADFNTFAHNPVDYAKRISCPTLLLYGERDETVSPEETHAIFGNLRGLKTLHSYPEAGHENFLIRYREEWTGQVKNFLAAD